MRQPRWVAAISLLVALVWLASEVSAQIPAVGGDKFQGLKWTFARIKYGSYEGEGNGNGRNSQLAYWDEPWAIDAPAAEQPATVADEAAQPEVALDQRRHARHRLARIVRAGLEHVHVDVAFG